MAKPTWIVNSPAVVSEIIDGELVVMNLETGNYFSSADSGALVWSCIDKRLDPEAIVAAVVAAFDVQSAVAAQDLDLFVESLRAEKLVRDGEAAAGAAAAPAAASRAPYSAPALRVYSDMKDLLLLDPIHDVALEGWPSLPEPARQAG